MRKLTIAALFVTAAGTFTLAAVAQGSAGEGRGQMWVEKLDTNGDGDITRAEVEAHKAARFTGADANGDGAVTIAEFETYAEAEKARRAGERRQRMFARMDANGDGSISAAEYGEHKMPRMDRMFDRIDSDDDGVITEAEREAAKAKHMGRRGNH